ncbi:hypothetical protein [Jannaschia formosa]|uniref:hypothetical protein n=1 Tax=Jannaschia formosa TaxID=2259592 RepID=UPI001430B61A|nr:hypothetical protein [Jannaschia formosa]
MADPNDLTRDELIARTVELQARCDQLIRILRHLLPERSGLFFICGEGGEQDEHGLPEAVEICPTYGADWSVLYRREGPRSERVPFEAVDAGSLEFDVPPSEGGGDGHG